MKEIKYKLVLQQQEKEKESKAVDGAKEML